MPSVTPLLLFHGASPHPTTTGGDRPHSKRLVATPVPLPSVNNNSRSVVKPAPTEVARNTTSVALSVLDATEHLSSDPINAISCLGAMARAQYLAIVDEARQMRAASMTIPAAVVGSGARDATRRPVARVRDTGIMEAVVRRPKSQRVELRREQQLGVKAIDTLREAEASVSLSRPMAASATLLAELAMQRALAFDERTSVVRGRWQETQLLPILHIADGHSHEQQSLQPASRLKLAVASLVFRELDAARVLPPVMSLVRGTLMNAIYVNHDVRLSVVRRNEAAAEEVEEQSYASDAGFWDLETYVDALASLHRATRMRRSERFAQAFKAETTSTAEAHGMNRLLTRIVARSHLRAWRQAVRAKPARVAERFLASTTQSNDRFLAHVYLTKWREWTASIIASLRPSQVEVVVAEEEPPCPPSTAADIGSGPPSPHRAIASKGKLLSTVAALRRHTEIRNASDDRQNEASVNVLKRHVSLLQRALQSAEPGAASDALLRSLREERVAVDVVLDDDLNTATVTDHSSPLHSHTVPPAAAHRLSVLRNETLQAGDEAIHQSRQALHAISMLRHSPAVVGHVNVENADEGVDAAGSMDIAEMLLLWVNQLLETEGLHRTYDLRAVSLDMSFADGKLFAAIGGHLYANHFPSVAHLMSTEPNTKRILEVLRGLKKAGCFTADLLVNVQDIAGGGVGTELLLAHLWRVWYKLRETEITNPTASHEISETSTRLLYAFADALKLPGRALTTAMGHLYSRCTEWIEARLMSRLRECGGAQGGAANATDLMVFTKAEPHYFGDIDLFLSDRHAELTKVSLVLKSHYASLRRIFDFYHAETVTTTGSTHEPVPSDAGTDDGAANSGARISAREMMRFLEDTRLLLKPKITKQTVLGLFDEFLLRQVHRDEPDEVAAAEAYRRDASTNAAGTTAPPHASLYFRKADFIELIVRIAALTVTTKAGQRLDTGVVAAALEQIITVDVIPRAMTSNRAAFKQSVADARVRDVLAQHAKLLAQLYRHHASVEHATGKPILSREQFIAIFVELQLVDKQLNRAALQSIFIGVQSDDIGGTDEGGEVMSLAEFTDAIVAVALFKNPSPLEAVHVRLRNFFIQTLVPICTVYLQTKKRRNHLVDAQGKGRR